MEIVNNPHDKFIKEMLGNVSLAQNFLKHYLPDELLGIIQLETASPMKDSFITEDLQEYFSDLLFRVNMNDKEGYVCFLFEHKSYRQKDIVLQLLNYMVEIWKGKMNKESAEELPMILPIVMYHGKQTWNIEQQLGNLIVGYHDFPLSIKRYIPDYEYLLYDLSTIDDEEISGGTELRLFLETLKYIFVTDVEHTIIVIEKAVIDVLAERLRMEFVHTLITYILNARDDLPVEKMGERLTMEGRKIFMSVADQLKEKGREEGREEGEMEGIKKVARRLIQLNMDDEQIMAATGLSKEAIERLKDNEEK